MFTCIACTKQTSDERDEDGRESGTPSTKEAVKSITTQVLVLVLSLSSFTIVFAFSLSFLHFGETNKSLVTPFDCDMFIFFC